MSFIRHERRWGAARLTFDRVRSKVTGGTAATILNLFEQFPTREILDSMKPYALSPVSNDHQAPKLSLLSSLTGVTKVPGLGLLCTSAPAGANMAMVHRTWGLMKQETGLREEWYGPNFTYREYMYAGNRLKGMLIHYSLLTGGLLLLLPPFRALVKQLVFNPGEGPDQEQAKAERIEFRAVAKLDNGKSTAGKQILGKLSYTGSMYYRKLHHSGSNRELTIAPVTAGFIAQAAGTLLQDDGPQLRGGVYTPACLGQPYINRLQEVGFKFETEVQTL